MWLKHLFLSKNGNFLPVSLLMLIAFVTHIPWFNFSTVLTSGDWNHIPDGILGGLYKDWSTWTSFGSFGGQNIQLPFISFIALWSLGANIFGLSYDDVVKLTLLIPIAVLQPLGAYLLVRKITGNTWISFLMAIFYSTNTYAIGSHIPISMVYSLLPFMFLVMIKALESGSLRWWSALSLLITLGIGFEVRMMYIVIILMVTYALGTAYRDVWKRKFQLAFATILTLFLNLYWLLPIIFGNVGGAIGSVANRGLFGDNLFDLQHALTLSIWQWTGSKPNSLFQMQPVLPYLWILPLLAIFSFVLIKYLPKAHYRNLFFFGVVSLVGILLSKQSAQPIESLYLTLYETVPGFSLFREASKFYLITAFGYLGLISFFFVSFRAKFPKYFKYAAGVFAVICLVNTTPLITGSYGGLFVSRDEPNDYKILNKEIMSQEEYFRTLWLPTSSRWGDYSVQHPKVGFASVSAGAWKDFIHSGRAEEQPPDVLKSIQWLESADAERLVDSGSIKYVILPLRDRENNDDFFNSYGTDRARFIDYLARVPWLKQIDIGTSEVLVYENLDYRPYVYTYGEIFSFGENIGTPVTERLFLNRYLSKRSTFASTELPTGRASLLDDVFDDMSEGQLKSGLISRDYNLPAENDSELIVSYPNVTLAYEQISEGSAKVVETRYDLIESEDEKDFNVVKSSTTLSTVDYGSSSTKLFYELDGNVQEINESTTATRNLGRVSEGLGVFKAHDLNDMYDGSFESDIGPHNIENCNNYDDREKPNLTQDIDKEEFFEGSGSLRLYADKHAVCKKLGKIKVEGGQSYLVDFRYNLKGARQLSYEVRFEGSENIIEKHDIYSDGSGWRRHLKLVTAPEGAERMQVVLKSYPALRAGESAYSFYDNVVIRGTENLYTKKYTRNKTFLKVDNINGEEITVNYKRLGDASVNLIPNPSFEEGLWQEEVGDCNAYDDKPDLVMNTSGDATHGSKSLEFVARKHTACITSGEFSVNESSSYKLSFDYKGDRAKQAGYFLSFNNENGDSIAENIPITGRDWNTYSRSIKVPFGATKAKITVYGFSEELASRKNLVRYDNISFIETPPISGLFYFSSRPKMKIEIPSEINVVSSLPYRKDILVEGAKTDFFFTMAEAYNAGWNLHVLKDGEPVKLMPGTLEHFAADDYLNGWRVDLDGLCSTGVCSTGSDGGKSFKLRAYFEPQDHYHTGVKLSSASLAVAGSLIVFDNRLKILGRKRRGR